MTATTSPTALQAATSAQMAALIQFKIDKAERILGVAMAAKMLLIRYQTKGGFYVSAKVNEAGETAAKDYFKSWNKDENEPMKLLFSKTLL